MSEMSEPARPRRPQRGPIPPRRLPPELQDHRFITTEQVVELFGMSSRNTVDTWVKQGDFPDPYKLNSGKTGKSRRNYYKFSEVMAWAEKYRVASESKAPETLDFKAAAKFLKMTTQELDRQMKARTAPPFKVNGDFVSFELHDLEQWKAKHPE